MEIVYVGAPSWHCVEHFGESQTIFKLLVTGAVSQVPVEHMPGTELVAGAQTDFEPAALNGVETVKRVVWSYFDVFVHPIACNKGVYKFYNIVEHRHLAH